MLLLPCVLLSCSCYRDCSEWMCVTTPTPGKPVRLARCADGVNTNEQGTQVRSRTEQNRTSHIRREQNRTKTGVEPNHMHCGRSARRSTRMPGWADDCPMLSTVCLNVCRQALSKHSRTQAFILQYADQTEAERSISISISKMSKQTVARRRNSNSNDNGNSDSNSNNNPLAVKVKCFWR